MSSPGINPLAVYDPQTYAAQLAIQRRMALAQSLMQEGGGNPGYAQYGGLRNAGNAILGAFLAKRADRDLGNLYNPQSVPNQGQTPPSGPSPQAMGSPMAGNNLDAEGSPVSSYQPPQSMPQAQQQPNQAVSTQFGNNPPDYASLPPQAQRIYDQIPHIPGMPARQALNYFMTNPSGYQAAWSKLFQPTPEQQNAAFVSPNDPEAQRRAVGGIQAKAGTTTGRAGNALIGPNGQTTYVPPQAPPGYTYIQGQDGHPYMVQIGGGLPGVAQSGLAAGVPKALLSPHTGYGADNMPAASNDLAMSGNAGLAGQYGIGQPPQPQGLNINANNPLNVQSGGRDIPYSTPTAGLGKAWEVLGSYGQKGINTVSKIVSTWAPDAPPQYVASVAQALKVDPNQPLNLSDPNVKGALIDAMRPNETGNRYAPQQQPGKMLPELPQGQATYMQSQAKDAADRHDQVVAAAAESPMRINVLDNILNLSKQGVATGPGQEWQNAVLGYAANTPILAKFMGGAKDNVAKFQELQKFTYQNALRNWQAAGGTGTDAQMESQAHANPNSTLFPQALQQIAQWAKASELAIQGKANAQDKFLQQNGQTPQNQIAFERGWRNSFDPKVFQYSLMNPQEKQDFVNSLGRNKAEISAAAAKLKAKQDQLRAMGALQ